MPFSSSLKINSMHHIIANRALGILKLFLGQYPDKKKWALPATICFSVPALFYSEKKEIYFYDFSIDNSNLLEKKILLNCDGILAVDYYGTEKTDVCVFKKLKESGKIIIYDKCLSAPDFTINPELLNFIDLVLFSTGDAKVVDLGYGGYGISRVLLKPGKYNAEVTKNYLKLDKEWDIAFKSNLPIQINRLHENEWVDISDNHIQTNYKQGVKKLTGQIMVEKNKINAIYKAIIPPELIFTELSDVWRFNLLIKNRDFLLREIYFNKLFVGCHYADMSVHFNFRKKLNYSKFIEKHILNLYNDRYITPAQAEKCAELIRILYEQGRVGGV
ncbi:MAG: hypothetical protein A3G23_14625 [Bacteroidetes bacterium RIFCSPLOWO2_12_FULL_37_12]|nr:MAG: hypothetical protein A3G23_14625 [Bacteroidetes bacterium RIFCSPLOWO2_12_FULL_37_12]